jgi:hemerythrin-like domain-containing protein
MKRHPGLVPLTHDHHHALAQARRLLLAARGEPSDQVAAARTFTAFFEHETRAHFREEEELLFPLLVENGREPPEELTTALMQHVRIHALVMSLRREVEEGSTDASTLRAVGDLLKAHIRLEESRLFPLIERAVSDTALAALPLAKRTRQPEGTAQ